MDFWTTEQLAAQRRHEALNAAAERRRETLLGTSATSWRVDIGGRVVRLGRWIGGASLDAQLGFPPAQP